MGTLSLPGLAPGQYYIGVSNADENSLAQFSVNVDIGSSAPPQPRTEALAPGSPKTVSVPGAGNSPAALSQTQYTVEGTTVIAETPDLRILTITLAAGEAIPRRASTGSPSSRRPSSTHLSCSSNPSNAWALWRPSVSPPRGSCAWVRIARYAPQPSSSVSKPCCRAPHYLSQPDGRFATRRSGGQGFRQMDGSRGGTRNPAVSSEIFGLGSGKVFGGSIAEVSAQTNAAR